MGVFRRMRGGGLGTIRGFSGLLRGDGRRLGVRSILKSLGSVMFLKESKKDENSNIYQ